MPSTQEVEGLPPTGSTCLNTFSDLIDQDIHTQCALSWKIVVSEWRAAVHDCSVTESWRWHPPYQTAKTVHCATKTLQTQRLRMHGTGCARP